MLSRLFAYASLEQPRQFDQRLFLIHLQVLMLYLCFALFVFYHLGSLGIYFDKMDPNFEKNDQKCSVGGANGNFTRFC